MKVGMKLITADEALCAAVGSILGDVLELPTGLALAAASSGEGASWREELVEAFRGDGRRFLDLLAAQKSARSGGRRAQRRRGVLLLYRNLMLFEDAVLR